VGSWKIVDTLTQRRVTEGGHTVFEMGCWATPADWALLKSAPEMRSALEQLLDCVDRPMDGDEDSISARHAIDYARSVITKATTPPQAGGDNG